MWVSVLSLIALTLPLLVLKRWISQHVQGIGLLIFNNPVVTMMLYFILFLPGILLHETSHWLVARLLGLTTGKFSLGPQKPARGKVSLGSVQISRSDPIRESLVGLAPFASGTLTVLALAHFGFGLPLLTDRPPLEHLTQVLGDMFIHLRAADAYVWLYLIFAVSNSMFPSETDREPWRMLTLYLTGLSVLYVALAGVPQVPEALTRLATRTFDGLVFAFGLTIVVDLIFIGFILIAEMGVGALRGQRINY